MEPGLILAFINGYRVHRVFRIRLCLTDCNSNVRITRETVVQRIACNNVRYTRLTSRYVEFCQPLGDVQEPDTFNLSARLKKSIPYPLGVAEKTIWGQEWQSQFQSFTLFTYFNHYRLWKIWREIIMFSIIIVLTLENRC